MTAGRVGRILLTVGLGVGIVAGIGLIVGFEPARLPPALLNVALYKLTIAAALGLLAGGAMVLRYSRREEAREAAALSAGSEAMKLTEGQAPGVPGAARRAERVRTGPGKRDM